ncbi:TIGR00730 family Rossman fold protein [Corynebacterium sp.]|uniref:TIGR00730 family Rossman fold protein n=1 Tax=Corynebacterium sp. TaxID=1720 RepID=UPI0026E07AE9|nr:TIGR00730 family Rossman fold protein [Corynebacterium sp.]MDO5512568.1 TIGR00730 family Rossman fold protein [Corynebacterium sp.]
MGLTFRPMTVDDHELRRAATVDNTRGDEYREFDPTRGDAGFIALADDHPVGLIQATFIRGWGFVAADIPEITLHVAEGYRGQGIGARLLEELKAHARVHGWPGLSLSVEEATPARRLYERAGFIDRAAAGTMLLNLSARITSVAVYCGSSHGTRPEYTTAARELGHELARRHLTLVYGGGAVGLMGVVADACVDKQGAVTGVIPRQLVDRELAHPGLTRLEIVETMAQRKTRMEQLADAFIALPGGAGTLEELFEVLTMQQLGHIRGPVALCNTEGFWDPQIAMLHRAVDEGFLRAKYVDCLVVADTPADVLEAFTTWEAPGRKWD